MKVLKILITIILLASFVLVGTPIKYNCLEFNLIVILAGIVFGVYKLVFKKEKLISSKIDILILILYLTPIVPILFGNNVSLEETLIAITRNVSLITIYLMLKGVLNKDKKASSYIVNILVIGGVFLAFLGIDEMTSYQFFRYMRFIGIPNILNHENRMISTIGYANTFAIIMAAEIILCIERLKKHKIAYSGLIYFFLLAMLLSYSRSAIAIFVVIFSIYLILSKKNRRYVIYIFFLNLILALFGMKLFDVFSTNEQHLLAWLSIAVFTVLSMLIAKLICKWYKKICKIKIKTYILVMLACVILIAVIFVIGMKLTIPLELFDKNSDNEEVRYKLNKVDASTLYTFEFNIEAFVKHDEQSNYTIEIVEENKYYDKITTHQIQFGEYIGKKEISFTTSDETVAMVIYFKSKSKNIQSGLTINSLYVNDKEIGLNYLYIPTRLVERIDSFSISSKSVWERFVFHKDGLKIIKDNLLFGTGAKGWQYNYTNIQSYVYSSTEVHSYPLQLIIENGILAIVAYLGVLVYFIIKIIKARKIEALDIAYILLNMHALVDFDMSFYIVNVIWITLLALAMNKRYSENIEKNNVEINNDKKILKNYKHKLQFIVIVVNMIALLGGVYAYNLSNYGKTQVEEIKRLTRKDNFNEAIELMKDLGKDNKYKETIYNKLYMLEYDNITYENLQYIYSIILEKKIIANTSYNMMKNEIIQKIIKSYPNKEIVEKLANIVVEENDKMISNIKDRDKNRLNEDKIDMYLREQQEIYETCCNILYEE